MRIRKRYQSPLQAPDLSSCHPPSAAAAAAAVAPPVAAAGAGTGSKEKGEALAAAAAAAAAAAVRVPAEGVCGGEGGRGLHPNGRSANPTTCPPFFPPPAPSAAAAAGGAERGDLPPPGPRLPARDLGFGRSHGVEVPKRELGVENGEDGDAHSGDKAPVPKSSVGAEASEVSGGSHGGGRKLLPSGVAAVLGAAEAMVRWSDEEEEFPLKKRRGGTYHARGRSLGLEAEEEEEEEEEEEKVVAEREMKQTRPSSKRRRRAVASSSTTMAAAGTLLTSVGTDNGGGAPTATGDGAGAAKKCGDMVVKEEGVDVMPAATAAPVDGSRGGHGNGKKRRSPAVLMEGSRCSRVNGRGWRCCQQTLVGYSLCEHHLGKGRLRSVSSVRCNGRARKKEDVGDHGAAAPPLPSLLREQDQLILSGDGDYYYEEEIINPTKRKRIRNKIGMVKARSISSLLHQPDHPSTPTTIAAPEEPFPSPSPTPATRPVTAAAPSSYAL